MRARRSLESDTGELPKPTPWNNPGCNSPAERTPPLYVCILTLYAAELNQAGSGIRLLKYLIFSGVIA